MQAYRVDGSLRQGKTNQEFCIDIVAEDEDDAREKFIQISAAATALKEGM